MITEKQQKEFLDSLNTVLNKNIVNQEETYKKYSAWLKRIYYKYKNNILPKEHQITLKKRLAKIDITMDEFIETNGSIDLLQKLHQNKKNSKKSKDNTTIKANKNDTEEELKKTREELIKTISSLKTKITKRNRSLYRLTDEACEEIEKQIAELENELKGINKQIEQPEPQQEKIEISDSTSKKIKELLISNKEKEEEIKELKRKLDNQYEQEVKNKETIQQQKSVIQKLLLEKDVLSLDDIKSQLKDRKISTSNLSIAFNELRAEIPGIVKKFNKDGLLQTYSIEARVTDKLKALKESTTCPRISNVFEGTIKFILEVDPHIPLESTEYEIKKAQEPFLQYSSDHNNIPIIGLGDYADTIKNIEFERWQKMDKEAINYSYNFYKNFAKTIATCPKTMYYALLGNHDRHPYLVGVDPIEIINNYSDNTIFLGIEKGQFMLGNDKIGVFHGVDSVHMISGLSYQQMKLTNYNDVSKEIKNIINDNIYLLIAHYHQIVHNPLQHFSLVYTPMLCTAEIEDGHVKRMFIQQLNLTKKRTSFIEEDYPNQTEIYNSEYQYRKIKSH